MDNSIVTTPLKRITETIAALRVAAQARKECVVLWLAREEGGCKQVKDVYVPEQVAEEDFFRIPPPSMRRILTHLRENDLLVAAQVHSHPREAFHSDTDNHWAIVRHTGALSIVVPYFSQQTTAENFTQNTALFALSAQNIWEPVAIRDTYHHYRIEMPC